MTGHRASHSSFPNDTTQLDAAIDQIFCEIDAALKDFQEGAVSIGVPSVRLHTLLSDGADHHAARCGLDRGWGLSTPLPFGRALNAAINADVQTVADAKAVFAGQQVTDSGTANRLAAISDLMGKSRVFELADDDARLTELFLASFSKQSDASATARFASEAGKRVALAGRILIEQSDLVVAIWDQATTANIGGTGHTALAALNAGIPVLLIDPVAPDAWRVVLAPEDLASTTAFSQISDRLSSLHQIVLGAVSVGEKDDSGDHSDLSTLDSEHWRDRSSVLSHAFRRTEMLFGETSVRRRFASVRQTYERPEEIAAGSAKALIDDASAISSGGSSMGEGIAQQILPRFAWLDGISAHLSDRHRSGMTLNFILGACAIIGGILYLPLVDPAQKWIFASIELAFLLAILLNTSIGRKLRIHDRWFETRRAAEYLRYSPMLSILGVARPAGEWPHGAKSRWPEWYVKHISRAVGLPECIVDEAYLKSSLAILRDQYVDPQRSYHRAKSERLSRVHHGLDHLSEWLFVGGVLFVALYLILAGLSALAVIDPDWLTRSAKWFTVLAVAMPTLGGALAGIRYFGDFERFAEISDVTSEKLNAIADRLDVILNASDNAITYSHASEIMRAANDVVFAEIQSWQSVFRRKVIAVPA